MNFDELQKQWQNEEVSAPEISLDHQHKINNPLEKIRRNMKMEFWYSIVSYVLIIAVFFPFIIKNEDRFIIIFLILLGIGITAYYFAKFFKLYQIISKVNLTTNYHLLNLRSELVIHKELYKSYYIAFIPILVCVLLVSTHFTLRNQTQILIFSFSFFFMCFFLYIVGKIWLKELYGKYINEISSLIQSLNEDDTFDVDRKTLNIDYNFKNPLYFKSKVFFEKKFGDKGLQINFLIWMVISFIILFILSGLVGFAAGYFGAKYNVLDAKDLFGK